MTAATHLKAAASVSLGMSLFHGGFIPLDEKITALAQAGFQGVELHMWDLIPYAEHVSNCKLGDGDIFSPKLTEADWKLLIEAAGQVGTLCKSHGLEVLSAAALFDGEGWSKDSEEAAQVRASLPQWSLMMNALGTEMLVVVANRQLSAQTDLNAVAEDLGEIADVLRHTGQRIAYENVCWATTAPNWSAAWEVVKRADRSNLGLCFDLFHLAGSEWADPTTASGRIEEPNAMVDFEKSMSRLTAEVPHNKIYSIQLGDAYKLPVPADPKKLTWAPKMYWAAGFRGARGGFLPVRQMMEAILKTGYQGPISIEAINAGQDGKTVPTEPVLEQAMVLAAVWDEHIHACCF